MVGTVEVLFVGGMGSEGADAGGVTFGGAGLGTDAVFGVFYGVEGIAVVAGVVGKIVESPADSDYKAEVLFDPPDVRNGEKAVVEIVDDKVAEVGFVGQGFAHDLYFLGRDDEFYGDLAGEFLAEVGGE
jgi:hypothetical protein